MKKYIIIFIICIINLPLFSQSFNYNYIRTCIPKVAVQNSTNALDLIDKQVQYEYLDGLGRSIQIINQQFSADWNGKDLVQSIAYDNLGRQSYKFLPYTSNSYDGSFQGRAFIDQSDFYNNPPFAVNSTPYPYSQTIFEPSPLNRVVEQGASGTDWQPIPGNSTGHTSKLEYGSNNLEPVPMWNVIYLGGSPNGAQSMNSYAFLELIRTIAKDENGNQVFEYRDKLDRIVCKRVLIQCVTNHNGDYVSFDFTNGQNNNTNYSTSSLEVETDYIYNELGQLTYVVQPKGTLSMIRNGTMLFSESFSDPIFNDFIFGYHYDERGRLVEKRVPGQKEWNYFVYNKLDQLVLEQSPNQRSNGEWNFTKYDAIGRTIITGKFNSSISRIAMQSQVDGTTDLWEKMDYSSNNGYTSDAYPLSPTEIYTVNYFDDYNFIFDPTLNSRSYQPYSSNALSVQTTGLLTATKVEILGTGDYLYTLNYYDEKERLIQQQKQHQMNGWDVINNEYDFKSHLTKTVRNHNNPNLVASPLVITSRYLYDHIDRLTDIFKQINSETEIHMVYNQYNCLGQLQSKSLHFDWSLPYSYLQLIDYRYNSRGWLSSINNAILTNDNGITNSDNWDAFGEEIYYNNINLIGIDNSLPNSFTILPQYNGNIAGIRWKIKAPNASSNSKLEYLYGYRYDELNRMTAGYFAGGVAGVSNWYDNFFHGFDEKIQYDVNGNISQFDRTYKQTPIDKLDYTYIGNFLDRIDDQIPNSKYGFNDVSGHDYTYDNNGNLKSDRNKSIPTIQYNYLNLPELFNSSIYSNSISYTYDATGRKLSKNNSTTLHQYIDGIEFEDGKLQFITTEEGKIRPKDPQASNNSNFVFDYFLKDHLGNIRVVLTNELMQGQYAATMEIQNSESEGQLFNNIPTTREAKPSDYPTDETYEPNQKVSQLNAADGKTIGHAKVLKVIQGDVLDFDTKYFFSGNPFVLSSESPISDILSQLANIFIMNPPSSIAGTSLEKQQAWANQTFLNNQGVSDFLNSTISNDNENEDPAQPRAYLVWLMFNEDFKFISDVSGVQQVNSPDELGNLGVLNLKIPDNGYMYIYVSNESAVTVNFDNLIIHHTIGYIRETNDYYPYGYLNTYLSTTPQNGFKNQYKYNGKELQTDLDWNVEDYGARQYDPVIGRWLQVDPLAEKYRRWSPYNYAVDNPVRFVDPDGRGPEYVGSGTRAKDPTPENQTTTTARDNLTTLSMPEPLMSQAIQDREMAPKTGLNSMSNEITIESGVTIGYGEYKVGYSEGNVTISGRRNIEVTTGKSETTLGVPSIVQGSVSTQKTLPQIENMGNMKMFTWNEQTTISATIMGVQKFVQVTNKYLNSGILIKSDTMSGTNLDFNMSKSFKFLDLNARVIIPLERH